MQLKRAGSIIALVCALIAGLIATSSAYIGWILIDETRLGWVASRGIAFMALIVGVLSLILLTGGLETSSKELTTG